MMDIKSQQRDMEYYFGGHQLMQKVPRKTRNPSAVSPTGYSFIAVIPEIGSNEFRMRTLVHLRKKHFLK